MSVYLCWPLTEAERRSLLRNGCIVRQAEGPDALVIPPAGLEAQFEDEMERHGVSCEEVQP